MKQLPLHQEHQTLGARFSDVGGWEVPADYGDPLREYRAVQESAGLFDLTYRGKIRVTGRDRVKFLQGILSQDIPKIPAGRGGYAALLNLKGKMVSDLRVLVAEEAIFLDTEGGVEKTVLETLNRYAMLSDVKLDDVTESIGLLSLQGPQATNILEECTGVSLSLSEEFSHHEIAVHALLGTSGGHETSHPHPNPPPSRGREPGKENSHPEGGGAGESATIRVIRASRTGSGGYDLLIPREHLTSLWSPWLSRGGPKGLLPAGSTALEILRIEMGTPRFGADMDEDTFPLEAGILNAISFEKGCYLGQEPVARMHFRGHPNRHLVGITLEGDGLPKQGDKVYKDDKEVGWITSPVFSPALRKAIALGYVRRENHEVGETLMVETAGVKAPASVTALPFRPTTP